LLLGWLNLHDRPAVQVEALLTLTNIAELCAQQSCYSNISTSSPSSSVKPIGGDSSHASLSQSSGLSSFYSQSHGDGFAANANSNSHQYSSLIPPTPGGVPFPPLSFSQTLSPEALAAFDASLTSTIQQAKASGSKSNSVPNALTNTLNFSSKNNLCFSSTSSTTSSFIPPPTPVSNQELGSMTFPQQLSASSQHLLLRHADAIPTLISLLSSPNKEVYEQAMWILGSIATGDSTGTSNINNSSNPGEINREKSVAARDVILAAGVMKQMLRCLDAHPTNLSLQRIGSWTLSNLVEGIFQQPSHGKSGSKPEYSSSDEIEMEILLPVLKRLLRMSDAEVLSYTCWTLSHLCDGPSSHISAVVISRDRIEARGGLVPRLVELLGHSSWRVTKPALRTIGNIVCAECSDDSNQSSVTPTDYTEVILECGAVPKLKELVTHNNREIQKEACWTLSNIAAGTVDQIQAVIDSGAIPPLVKLVSNKATDQEVRSEACWVVLNATSCGSDSQIEVLVAEGCVSVLGLLLSEASMVMMALEGLERVLQVEEAREMARKQSQDLDTEEISPSLVSASLIEKALDKHNSSAVTKRASRIWKQHFVSCALCHTSFSKHRTTDATFCEECKCYVCSSCDCQIYHLSYQEELWAATEVQTEAKKNAKKSKKAKRKEKQKQKKAVQPIRNRLVDSSGAEPPLAQGVGTVRSRSSTVNSLDDSVGHANIDGEIEKNRPYRAVPNSVEDMMTSKVRDGPSPACSDIEDEDKEGQDDDPEQLQPPIDFVLYLQQTGSIIALAKLMDALDYGEGIDGDLQENIDYKLQKQTTSLHSAVS
jgi:importin subunit alpha-6/7